MSLAEKYRQTSLFYCKALLGGKIGWRFAGMVIMFAGASNIKSVLLAAVVGFWGGATVSGAEVQFDPGSEPGQYVKQYEITSTGGAHDHDYRHPDDGSRQWPVKTTEFQRSSFVDGNFGRQSFRGSAGHVPDRAKRYYADLSGLPSHEATMSNRPLPDYAMEAKLNKPTVERGQFEQVMKPLRNLLQDWVPDKIDDTANGAFGVAPDNGSPVPYRLNGHLDFDRSLPWEMQP